MINTIELDRTTPVPLLTNLTIVKRRLNNKIVWGWLNPTLNYHRYYGPASSWGDWCINGEFIKAGVGDDGY